MENRCGLRQKILMPMKSYNMAPFTSYCESVTRSARPAVVFLVMVTSYTEEFPDEGHVNITLPDINFVDISCDWATKQTKLITFLTSSFCIPLNYNNIPQLILLTLFHCIM